MSESFSVEKTFTHKDLATLLGVSETTIKSYRRKFPNCIPVANQGKPIRFTADAGNICLRIRDLFELGMSVTEVRCRLAAAYPWIHAQEENEACAQHGQDGQSGQHGQSGQKAPEAGAENAAQSITSATEQSSAAPQEADLQEKYAVPPHLLSAISNFAKTSVVITQQQSTILKKVHTLEEQFAEALATISTLQNTLNAALQEAGLSNVQSNNNAAQGFAPNAGVTGDFNNTAPIYIDANADGGAFSAPMTPCPEEWLTLPLCYRAADGSFVGVAGRARRHFNCNDFLALLDTHYFGKERYSMAWQAEEDAWVLLFSQPQSSHPAELAFGLLEQENERGERIVCLMRLFLDGEAVAVENLSAFIDGIHE